MASSATLAAVLRMHCARLLACLGTKRDVQMLFLDTILDSRVGHGLILFAFPVASIVNAVLIVIMMMKVRPVLALTCREGLL